MAKTPSDHLLSTLEELVPYDFEKFKFKLQNTSVEKEHSRIPRSQIQRARPVKMASLLVTYYGEDYAVRLTLQVLRAINQRLLAEELHRATVQDMGSRYVAQTGLELLISNNPPIFASQTAGITGRPPDKAASPRCYAQEGDPVGEICVRDSCSCPEAASGHPQASGSRSPDCPQCQAFHERKGMGSLSPQPFPQCKRHMKQVQLLFCEDHREPICLICSLSQEHRGHRVRPIEEAALEHKKQIQKQLERLKELRKSGEEQRSYGEGKAVNFLEQTEALKQRMQRKLQQVYHFLEQQEHVFMASLENVGQMVGQIRKAYDTRISQDITLLDALIGELEAKQCQSEWELLQDIGDILHRAKTVPVPERWTTPQEMKQKIQLLHQKSEFVEKSAKYFLETLRSKMEMFNVPELIGAQAHAVNVTLDAETAYPSLVVSDDLKSVRLGNKRERLPDGPQRFDSCIVVLGSPSFLSGHHYWEVEVRDKTAWILGACKASISRKGNMTLSPENGYWVVIMMKENEYQASSVPPTRLQIKVPPKRVGIFVDYRVGSISFYNVTARSCIYTFTSCCFSEPLQPIFSPGTHDGGKNTAPLTICPVGGQGPE
uniref:Pyrin n=1 Tax=Colobus angolensis palliatus TaxID=336983 RepID=A0A2K5K321_COLAP